MVAKKLEFHPASNLFPLMEGAEFTELVASIKEHGQQVPILLYQGKVIDGRNRLRACYEAGVDPQCEHSDLNGISPTAFVLIHNLTRRHLTLEQRAFVAADALPMFEAEAAERMKSGKASDPTDSSPQGMAIDVAGATAHVSGKTVERAAKVKELGSVALVEAAKAGEISLSAAASIADAPKLEQTAALKAGPAAVKALAAEVKAEKKKAAAKEKPAPRKRGQSTVDLRKFSALEKEIGKCVRLNTAIKEHCGGASFHEGIRVSLNDALKTLAAWRKESTK